VQEFAAFVIKLKAFIRVSKAVVGDERPDMGQFRWVGAQKLLSGWYVEEQIANRDRSANCASEFVASQQLAAGDFDSRTGLFIDRMCLEQQAADRGDGWESLAAKAKSRDCEQVLHVDELAGGVALKR
jgi:hypothetical protein